MSFRRFRQILFYNSQSPLLFCPEKPGPLGQVRVLWLCLGVLCLKSQIPSTKSQINLKFQYSMTKTGLKNERPTSNVQRRIMVRPWRSNFIKNTEQSDTHIRRSMLSVRCSTLIFFLFGIWNFGHWKLFDICNLIFGISINQ